MDGKNIIELTGGCYGGCFSLPADKVSNDGTSNTKYPNHK